MLIDMPGRLLRNLLVLGIILLAGCSRHERSRYMLPKFPEVEEKNFEILTGPLMYTMSSAIQESGPYLVVMAADADLQAYCHIYDKQGSLLGYTFHRGRARGEIVGLVGDLFVSGESVTYVDRIKKASLTFDIEDFLSNDNGAVEEYAVLLSRWEDSRRIAKDYEVSYAKISPVAQTGDEVINRITVLDQNENVVATNNTYPEEDGWKNWADTYHLSTSPDGSKLAIVPSWSGTMELFDLPDLQRRYTGYFAPQEFESTNGGVGFTDKTALMFTDVCATDTRVYAAWGGDVALQPNERLPESERAIPVNKIDIFDWNGKPLRRIVTDYRIDHMCVDSEERNIYAILRDPEDSYYIGRVSL